MTRDIKATRDALWRAVLEYGSIAHLARALDVTQEQLTDWLNGDTEIPLDGFERIVELVAPLDADHHKNASGNTKYRVLVVDDQVDAAETLSALLRLMGHNSRCTARPTEALDIARLFRPDIVFLDIAMPMLDGLSLAKTFRSDPGLKNVILVALTAHGTAADRARVRRAGFDAHLLKPAEPPLLESLIRQFQATPGRQRG